MGNQKIGKWKIKSEKLKTKYGKWEMGTLMRNQNEMWRLKNEMWEMRNEQWEMTVKRIVINDVYHLGWEIRNWDMGNEMRCEKEWAVRNEIWDENSDMQMGSTDCGMCNGK